MHPSYVDIVSINSKGSIHACNQHGNSPVYYIPLQSLSASGEKLFADYSLLYILSRAPYSWAESLKSSGRLKRWDRPVFRFSGLHRL